VLSVIRILRILLSKRLVAQQLNFGSSQSVIRAVHAHEKVRFWNVVEVVRGSLLNSTSWF
jgi:dTDP-4-dehydrorhamnose 3,5-epimerase-like enzyme